MKVCSVCGDTYRNHIDFCFNDGEVLTLAAPAPGEEDAAAADAPRRTQGNQSWPTMSATPVPRPNRRSLIRTNVAPGPDAVLPVLAANTEGSEAPESDRPSQVDTPAGPTSPNAEPMRVAPVPSEVDTAPLQRPLKPSETPTPTPAPARPSNSPPPAGRVMTYEGEVENESPGFVIFGVVAILTGMSLVIGAGMVGLYFLGGDWLDPNPSTDVAVVQPHEVRPTPLPLPPPRPIEGVPVQLPDPETLVAPVAPVPVEPGSVAPAPQPPLAPVIAAPVAGPKPVAPSTAPVAPTAVAPTAVAPTAVAPTAVAPTAVAPTAAPAPPKPPALAPVPARPTPVAPAPAPVAPAPPAAVRTDFRSEPAGAEVWIDGVLVLSKTPGQADLAPGSHDWEMRLPGHSASRGSLVAGKATVGQLAPDTPPPARVGTFLIHLSGHEAGLVISIDGVVGGPLPYRAAGLAEGMHVFHVTLPDGTVFERQLMLELAPPPATVTQVVLTDAP